MNETKVNKEEVKRFEFFVIKANVTVYDKKTLKISYRFLTI